MIKDHSTYIEAWKALAIAHVDIAHTESENHFARINLVQNPYIGAVGQLSEFLNGIGGRLKSPIMLLSTYQGGYKNQPPADALRKIFDGSIVILKKVKSNNADDEEQVHDFTEQICEDLISWWRDYFEENPDQGVIDWGMVDTEKVSGVAGEYSGTIMKFGFHVPYETEMRIKETKFNFPELN